MPVFLGQADVERIVAGGAELEDRKSTRLNSSHDQISYAVFCLKKKKKLVINHSVEMLKNRTYHETVGIPLLLMRVEITLAVLQRAKLQESFFDCILKS